MIESSISNKSYFAIFPNGALQVVDSLEMLPFLLYSTQNELYLQFVFSSLLYCHSYDISAYLVLIWFWFDIILCSMYLMNVNNEVWIRLILLDYIEIAFLFSG